MSEKDIEEHFEAIDCCTGSLKECDIDLIMYENGDLGIYRNIEGYAVLEKRVHVGVSYQKAYRKLIHEINTMV